MVKLAVAIIHGVGSQQENFADDIINELKDRFSRGIAGTAVASHLSRESIREQLECRPVLWAPVLTGKEQDLYNRTRADYSLDWTRLRRFFISLLGDGVAYQPVPGNADPYDQIHQLVANVLGELDAAAGPDAPLSIIAHSLGAVIASNFVWDAQHGTLPTPTASPLGRCETLTNFYTMGSPLAIWGLRYPDFGDPIAVPSSTQTALPGEWINFFDDDDIIAYPIQSLNAKYAAVVRDQEVNVGGWLSNWNPISHTGYWTDNDVTVPIASKLVQDWIALNP